MNPQKEVQLVGRHLELTDAIKFRVNEMTDKLYQHDERIDQIKIELGLERHAATHHDEFLAKGWIDDGRDHHIATAKGDDLHVVIGDLEEKLLRLIRRRSRRKVADRKKLKSIELEAELPKVDS